MNNFIYVVFFIIINILQLFVIYCKNRTVFYPSIFFQIYWLVQSIVTVLMFSNYEFDYSGAVWILIVIFLFNIGYLFSVKQQKFKEVPRNEILFNRKLAIKVLIMINIIALLYPIYILTKSQVSIKDILNINKLISINTSLAYNRYNGMEQGGGLGTLLLVFVYLASLIGGFNYRYSKLYKEKIHSIFSLFPGILTVLIQNTKSVLIACICLFISSYISAMLLSKESKNKVKIKYVIIAIIGIVSFVALNYFSMMLRIGHIDLETMKLVNEKFVVYSIGHIPGFCVWFSNLYNNVDLSYGIKTFFGISNLLGIASRSQGIYLDDAYWGIYSTNVYTAFRPIIEDFGVVFSCLIMGIYGVFINNIYSFVKYKKAVHLVPILSGFYFFTLYSFITSCWAYSTYILIFVLFQLYILLIIKQNKFIN